MPKTAEDIENLIIGKLVSDALAQGYSVSVDDGGAIALSKSTNREAILDAMRSTDGDYLLFHDASGKRIGWVKLVYGNDGYDVISDYGVNAKIEALLAGANAIAGEFA